jgi:hypothetical protein
MVADNPYQNATPDYFSDRQNSVSSSTTSDGYSDNVIPTNDTNRWHYGQSPRQRDAAYREGPSLVDQITRQNLTFDYLSQAEIETLLREREEIYSRNRAGIAGGLSSLSGEISCCENFRYNDDARQRRLQLLKSKADLERQQREEAVALWKDSELLRQRLVDAKRKYEAAKLRSALLT